jgi:mono/diheme cytochrome c family protein
MRNLASAVLCALLGLAAIAPHFSHGTVVSSATSLAAKAHTQRLAPTDLEIAGDIAGLAAGSARYLSREDLLTLPQVTYTVSDDSNFNGPTEISGVPLNDLIQALALTPDADLAIAICDDEYHAHYSRAYLAAHHPLLVLKVNGQPPEGWPKDAEGHGESMGPYMISHRQFTPGFKILAHPDEPQIPWGVVRLEFENEKRIFSAIAPRGSNAADAIVQSGYRIARQNCLRCHNQGDVGGKKAGRPWLVLSAWATASPKYFAAYIRNPQSQNSHAQMPANPGYDDATLQALTAYFRTFSSSTSSSSAPSSALPEKP